MKPSYEELEQKLIESERYGRQTDITIDNLEMKLAQMAAELASVKQQEPKAWFIRITDEVTVDAREGENGAASHWFALMSKRQITTLFWLKCVRRVPTSACGS